MPEPTLPQLRSLSVSATGRALSLRVLLPPNFASIAARGGKVPIKIEASVAVLRSTQEKAQAQIAQKSAQPHSTEERAAQQATETLPPEKLGKGPWSMEPGIFLAALLIESWCSGRIPSMLQLDAAQLSQLLQPLENTPTVFWLKAQQQPIAWSNGELAGVHEHLRPSTGGQSARTAEQNNRQKDTIARAALSTHGEASTAQHAGYNTAQHAAFTTTAAAANALPQMESGLMPLEVDGSANFLSLRMPSRESALHPHALSLAKDNGFQLEPSNGKWWLRDRHKTLQFLADNAQDLRDIYHARFTDNFAERTRHLHFARLEVEVRSTTPRGNDAFNLELFFSAPNLDEVLLQQALEKGQRYIEVANTKAGNRNHRDNRAAHSQNTAATGSEPAAIILVPRSVREQAEQTQQALGASAAQGLRTRFISRIRKDEVATTQAILQHLDTPAAQLPADAKQSESARRHSPHTDTRHASTNAHNASRRTGTRHAQDTGGDEPISLATKLPAQWLALSRALNDTSALSPCPMPPALEAILRPYQRVGAAWLWHLYRNGLGGILADEMGLGKTVQCLAFLAAAKEAQPSQNNPASQNSPPASPSRTPVPTGTPAASSRTQAHARTLSSSAKTQAAAAQTPPSPHNGNRPSLVVCPASLVDNWRREAQKFLPNLRVLCHHGDSRLADAQHATHYDLILTSYGTLVRDQALFESIEFLVAVGDEAQNIKNAKTQSARALRALRAEGRFLMTGTPVENDIRELQSLFSFILPGYLEPARNRTNATQQTAADIREEERARLVTRAAPYILRRMKRTVAADLPEKIEQVIYCELGSAQRAFYRQVQESARRAVQELELSGAADNRVRFAAFTELLRLRQVCIDPRLVDERAGELPSAKRETLLELVQEAVEGGHRLLIFSQFTSALKLVGEDFNALGLPHFYLDGQTRNRAALCERFNTDESVKAFLISLRAGGTGLNLTGADTVIHLDPWWNPAAQAQATDRAHRIGQQRVVTAYQLIAAQTVEEQVLTLQRQKSALLEQLLDASDASSAHIGLDDLKALIGEDA